MWVWVWVWVCVGMRSEEHTSELQSHLNLGCRLLLEKKNMYIYCYFLHSCARIVTEPSVTACVSHSFRAYTDSRTHTHTHTHTHKHTKNFISNTPVTAQSYSLSQHDSLRI